MIDFAKMEENSPDLVTSDCFKNLLRIFQMKKFRSNNPNLVNAEAGTYIEDKLFPQKCIKMLEKRWINRIPFEEMFIGK